MKIYIYMHIYVRIYNICIYAYTCNHENNAPLWLSPQWLCGNSCTSAHDRTSYAQVHELPQSHCGHNREGTLFS